MSYKKAQSGVVYMDFSMYGKRVHKSTRTKDVKLAKAVEEAERDKLKNNILTNAKGLRLSDAIDRCYTERWCKTKGDVDAYNRAKLLITFIGDKYLHKIDATDISLMLKKLAITQAVPATINRHLARLKTILKMGIQWKALSEIPYLPMTKEHNGRIRIITTEEESAICGYFKDDADMQNLVNVLINTGLRLSELLSLKYTDVDTTANMMRIWESKGNDPRSIPLTSNVRFVLAKRNMTNEAAFGKISATNKPLFSISINQVEKSWDRMRKNLGYSNDKEFVIHALRHTFASRLVVAGVDLYRVQKLLGHASIKTTQRYAHLQSSSLQDAVRILEKSLSLNQNI